MTDNYIQIVHEADTETRRVEFGPSTVEYETQDVLTFYAVRPPDDTERSRQRQIIDTGDEASVDEWSDWSENTYSGGPWIIRGGQAVYINDKEDIAGYRKLLDAIEANLVD